jgi:hypothetical protein
MRLVLADTPLIAGDEIAEVEYSPYPALATPSVPVVVILPEVRLVVPEEALAIGVPSSAHVPVVLPVHSSAIRLMNAAVPPVMVNVNVVAPEFAFRR